MTGIRRHEWPDNGALIIDYPTKKQEDADLEPARFLGPGDPRRLEGPKEIRFGMKVGPAADWCSDMIVLLQEFKLPRLTPERGGFAAVEWFTLAPEQYVRTAIIVESEAMRIYHQAAAGERKSTGASFAPPLPAGIRLIHVTELDVLDVLETLFTINRTAWAKAEDFRRKIVPALDIVRGAMQRVEELYAPRIEGG